MSQKLDQIMKELGKELSTDITRKVLEKLRDSYVKEITAIVKEVIVKDELLSGSSTWMSIDQLSKKYQTSRRTVNERCRLFKDGKGQIERKWVAGKNLINERQFIQSFDIKRRVELPAFLLRMKGKN